MIKASCKKAKSFIYSWLEKCRTYKNQFKNKKITYLKFGTVILTMEIKKYQEFSIVEIKIY